jgi:hypothetical protein
MHSVTKEKCADPVGAELIPAGYSSSKTFELHTGHQKLVECTIPILEIGKTEIDVIDALRLTASANSDLAEPGSGNFGILLAPEIGIGCSEIWDRCVLPQDSALMLPRRRRPQDNSRDRSRDFLRRELGNEIETHSGPKIGDRILGVARDMDVAQRVAGIERNGLVVLLQCPRIIEALG